VTDDTRADVRPDPGRPETEPTVVLPDRPDAAGEEGARALPAAELAATLVRTGASTPPEPDPDAAATRVRAVGSFAPLTPDTMVPLPVSPRDPGPPSRGPGRVGRYEVRRELGRGGMGVVWLAFDPQLKREVALKVLPAAAVADEQMLRRFRQEAEAVARLSHPNLVTVYEVGEAPLPDGSAVPYYTMEFVRGRTLAQEIRLRGKLSPVAAMRLLRDVARGAACAHAQGIVHRDIKPENVLLAGAEEGAPAADAVPKLADFGLARVLQGDGSPRLTATQVVMGTPAYMAPEQARGDAGAVGARSDVYALGAVLYEALAGRPPYFGDSAMDVVVRKLREDPPPLRALVPTLAPDVQTIVVKAMERDPSRRYADATELAEDLARCLEGEAIRARPSSRAYLVRRWIARNPGLAAAAGALALALLGIAGLIAEGVRREGARVRELDAERQTALERQRMRRAQALPHHLAGEDGREKARELVRASVVDKRAEILDRRSAILREAEKAYDKALEIDPEFAEAWAGRGRAFADLGDLPRALPDLDRAIALSPRYSEAYVARILVHTMEHDTLWTKSGKIRDTDFQQLTEFPDLSGDPVADRLVLQIREDVNALLDLGLKPEEAAYFKGWLARVSGDRDLARAEFEKCLQIWRWYAAGYEGRAALELVSPQPNFESVQRDLKRALAYDPGSLRARGVLLYLRIRTRDYLNALNDLQTLMKLLPRYAPLYLLRGFVRTNVSGEVAAGAEDFREAIRLDPSCALAYLNLGNLLVWQKQYEEAIAEYDRALKINDRHALIHLYRATALWTFGRREEALAAVERALVIDPGFDFARCERAQYLVDLGRADEAAADLRVALARDTAPTPTWIAYMNICNARGRLADAATALDEALAREPQRADLHFVRGLAFDKAGSRKDALAAVEKALGLGLAPPYDEQARRMRDRLRGK